MDPLPYGDRSDADSGLIATVGDCGSLGRESDAWCVGASLTLMAQHALSCVPPLDAHFREGVWRKLDLETGPARCVRCCSAVMTSRMSGRPSRRCPSG